MDQIKNMKQFKYTLAITMIELVVVVSIITILAAIGLPSYQTYLIESRRSDAINALQNNQLIVENYIQEHGITPLASQVTLLTESQENFYDIAYDRLDNDNYTIIATAKNTTSQNQDAGCTVITIMNKIDGIYPAACH